MGETAGSCGVEYQRAVCKEFASFGNRAGQTTRQNLRKEPVQEYNFGLTPSEKAEMLTYKAGKTQDWFNNTGGSICYSA